MYGFGLISGNWEAKCKRGKAQSEKVLFTVAPRGKSTFSQLTSSSVTANQCPWQGHCSSNSKRPPQGQHTMLEMAQICDAHQAELNEHIGCRTRP